MVSEVTTPRSATGDRDSHVPCRLLVQGGLDFTLGEGEFTKIGLIAGGIGISPMVQIIREVTLFDVCGVKFFV